MKITKKKIIFLISFILIIFVYPCHCHSSAGPNGHDEEIGYVIFGYTNWRAINTAFSEGTAAKYVYYICTNAASVAIDEQNNQGITDVEGPQNYKNLKENLALQRALTKNRWNVVLPDFNKINFPSSRPGAHRLFCHQGYVVEHLGSSDRWVMGKTKILLPSIAIAFDFSKKEFDKSFGYNFVNLISATIYYTHILGDFIEGGASGMESFSFYTNEYSKLLKQFGENINMNSSRMISKINNLSRGADFLSDVGKGQVAMEMINLLGQNFPQAMYNCSSSVFDNLGITLNLHAEKKYNEDFELFDNVS